MGYGYEDAWYELKALFRESKVGEETQVPLSEKDKAWIRNKMLDLEKKITSKEG